MVHVQLVRAGSPRRMLVRAQVGVLEGVVGRPETDPARLNIQRHYREYLHRLGRHEEELPVREMPYLATRCGALAHQKVSMFRSAHRTQSCEHVYCARTVDEALNLYRDVYSGG